MAGDVIVALDGKPVSSLDELLSAIEQHQVGDTVTLSTLNFYRAMAGLPADLVEDPVAEDKAQKLALMISSNFQTNPSPPPSWTCWTADGASAGGQSLQALLFTALAPAA